MIPTHNINEPVMLNRSLTILLVLGTLFAATGAAYAVATTYTVNYDKDSKYKPLPLKNSTLRIQLHANGTPHGVVIKQTDDKQKFILDNKYGDNLVVEVMSIKGEPKNISCHGAVRGGKTEILINCHPRNGKNHFY